MHDFVSHILRRYFETTGWNEYNSYLNLTASSSAVLDFATPAGLSVSISASPSPAFFTSYRLSALPTLRGGIGYIFASTDQPLDFGQSSKDVRFKDVIERFRVVEQPKRPLGKEPTWQSGQRIDKKDYLIYGCLHVPFSRLDALWTTRLSDTWQLIVTAVSTPPRYPLSVLTAAPGDHKADAQSIAPSASSQNLAATGGAAPAGSTNLQLTLQRDTGRWFTEYSYSADDALWGFRVLHNFGTPAQPKEDANFSTSSHLPSLPSSSSSSSSSSSFSSFGSSTSSLPPLSSSSSTRDGGGRIDESSDDSASVAGRGLRGRFSAGAEVFVSTVERSAGLSTGIRFSTLPDSSNATAATTTTAAAPGSQSMITPSQPPTVITATLNPMMGHLSTAYAARMSRDLVVCSRYDFNVYSYESELTMGVEYWLRSNRLILDSHGPTHSADPTHSPDPARSVKEPYDSSIDVASNSLEPPFLSLRSDPSRTTPVASLRPVLSPDEDDCDKTLASRSVTFSSSTCPPSASVSATVSTFASVSAPASTSSSDSSVSPISGVLKARISTTSDIRLLWQSRLRNCLVSLGVKADLNRHLHPGRGIVKSVGVEIMYFSQAE